MRLPEVILQQRVIPVARGMDAATAPHLVAALAEGGITSLEITVEATGGLEAIASVAGGETTVGAGTVVSVDQARSAADAGAAFLVTPHVDTELMGWATANDVPVVPGALTPGEIAAAWRYEPPAVKVFPAHVGGPRYLKSLLGPYPDLAMIPTGGVDGENVASFIAAGAVAVGVGGWLTSHSDLSLVTERARELVSRLV